MTSVHQFVASRQAAQESEDLDQLLTVEEAAKLLQVSEKFVYSHANAKARDMIPFVKIGTCTRFHESDLRDWIRRHAVGVR